MQLREDIKDPEFIKNLIKTYLIDNPHRVRLTMVPDTKLSERKQKEQAAKLAQIKAKMSDSEKHNIIDLAQKLAERQQQKDDESVLPKVGLEDIPDDMHIAQGDTKQFNGFKTTLTCSNLNLTSGQT